MKHPLPIPAKPGSTTQQLRDALAENKLLVDKLIAALKTIAKLENEFTPNEEFKTLLVINFRAVPEGVHFDIVQKEFAGAAKDHLLLGMAAAALVDCVANMAPEGEPGEITH